MRDWFRGTPDGHYTSMAVISQGAYGIANGLVCVAGVVSAEVVDVVVDVDG